MAPWRSRSVCAGAWPTPPGSSAWRSSSAHYLTAELDGGPIIEQDGQRVDHSHPVQDLRRIGRHIERMVLARVVEWHVENRTLVHGRRTIVFA